MEKSYDRISTGYDQSWTNHMRDLTSKLIDHLDPKEGDKAIDLSCGSGFATNLVAMKTGCPVTGIDSSEGMLTQARNNYSNSCDFINSDILAYLRLLPRNSLDLVTCCWALGYSKPLPVLREIKRVLKPGGKVAIIDNSLFSISEILYCSFLTFLEQPGKLAHLMRFRFLTGKRHLGLLFGILNMKPVYYDSGAKSYQVDSGLAAIGRLRATGAAAGFEYAAAGADEESIFQRFAEIIEQKYMHDGQIDITHRYLAGIARK